MIHSFKELANCLDPSRIASIRIVYPYPSAKSHARIEIASKCDTMHSPKVLKTEFIENFRKTPISRVNFGNSMHSGADLAHSEGGD